MRLSHENLIQIYDLLRDQAQDNHLPFTADEICRYVKDKIGLELYPRQVKDALGHMNITFVEKRRTKAKQIEALQHEIAALHESLTKAWASIHDLDEQFKNHLRNEVPF